MTIFYYIIPIGDGYHYLGLDIEKNHILNHKSRDTDFSLIFRHKTEAEQYIKKHLDAAKYEVEEILLNEKYYANYLQ